MKTTKFKPSEVGSIPEGWDVKRLGDCGRFSKGAGISRSQADSGRIPAVRYGELYTTHCNYIKSFTSFISEDVAQRATRLNKGDIVFACSGETKEEIGKCAAFIGDEVAYAGGDLIIFSPNKSCDALFIGFELNTPFCASQKAAAGQGDAVVHIRKESLEALIVRLPPSFAEQQAIAAVLSDVDALLSSMTTLIKKKQAIKQGTMQQLLTGKKRLAGFSGKWVEKRLGEVCEMNPPGEGIPEKFVYVDLESVVGGSLLARKIVERTSAPSRAQRRFKRGDILFQTVRPYQKNNLYVDFEAERFVASTGYAVLRGLPGVGCSSFVYHMLHTDSFTDAVLDRCTGTSYPAINPGKLAEIVLRLPQGFAEQKAIAAVLSDMDAEIAALESKRAKYESVKQGMMQELLTGKTRLV